MSIEVAPALSTAQGEDIFEFDQYKTQEIKHRNYLKPHDVNNKQEVIQLLREYYSIDELCKHLKNRYAKITLQFPDALVCDSSYVVQMLQETLNSDEQPTDEKNENNNNNNNNGRETKADLKKALSEIDFNSDHDSDEEHCATCTNCSCGKKESEKKHHKRNVNHHEVWVLADTSYSPCCVDEVAAEHVGADVVVHFGDSCLTPIKTLPSVYVFGKPYLDIGTVVDKFKSQYTDPNEKVIFMADTSYSYLLEDLYNELRKTYTNVAYAEVHNEQKSIKIIGYQNTNQEGVRFGNRSLIGINTSIVNIQDNEDEEELNSLLQEYNLFHITLPEAPRLLYLTTKFASLAVYDPKSHEINSGPFPSLMRRYRYMHVARTAGTVGILVNTLSLDNTKKMINIVAKWIKEADKKYYMFVVGKPNVAKLANFEVIDVWCILGCGQDGIIVDESNEYYKPIITPYELHLALSPEITWTGKWITEFKLIIDIDKEQSCNEDRENGDKEKDVASGDEDRMSDEDYAPEFSAVTGKYVSNSRPLRQIQHLQIELNTQESDKGDDEETNKNGEKQLVQKLSGDVVIKGDVSTSALQLQNRQWAGLGSDFQNDEDYDETGATVEEGRAGIARGYEFDRKTHKA